jgi:hypothetical protein
MSDIIKAVVFDHGTVELNGVTKRKHLVAMVILSDDFLTDYPECFAMGTGDMYDMVRGLDWYKPPHKLSDLNSAVAEMSAVKPEDLEPLEHSPT